MEDEQNLLNADLSSVEKAPQEASVEVPKENKEIQESIPETQEAPPEKIEEAEVPQTEISEAPVAAPVPPEPTPVAKDKLTEDIEGLLSEDLTDLFLRLPDAKKNTFKVAGEDAAGKIKVMMETGKVKAKKILELIRDWLRIVPGVNKFFLEQEAKIKTDKLMDYYRQEYKNQENVL